MSNKGWIKLWRKSLESGLLQNHRLWTFWCYCLLRATHKPIKQMVGWQTVELQPGQFVLGRKKAANDLNLTERQVRTCLKKLQNLGNLTIKSTNKFSIISINNWDSYQQEQPIECPTESHTSDQQMTSMRPAHDHKQEDKNGKIQEGYSGSSQEEHSTKNGEELTVMRTETTVTGIPIKKIISLWNSELDNAQSTMPKLKRLQYGTQRYKHVRARWRENPDLELWKTVIAKAAQSTFLNGRIKKWQADFDWIVKSPDNFNKVLEGKYDDRDIYADPNTVPF